MICISIHKIKQKTHFLSQKTMIRHFLVEYIIHFWLGKVFWISLFFGGMS